MTGGPYDWGETHQYRSLYPILCHQNPSCSVASSPTSVDTSMVRAGQRLKDLLPQWRDPAAHMSKRIQYNIINRRCEINLHVNVYVNKYDYLNTGFGGCLFVCCLL